MTTETTSGQANTEAATTAATAAQTTTTTTATESTTTAATAATSPPPPPAAAAATSPPPPPAAPAGAPEKYEFAQVEGINLGEGVLGKFGEVAKALNLTQENAQRVLSEVGPAIAAQQAAAMKAQVQEWETQAKTDKEIGGEKFAENMALAKKGLDAHFSKDFVAWLNQTGLGSHPEFIRGMMKAGKLVSEDRVLTGGSGAQQQGEKSAAERLYGTA